MNLGIEKIGKVIPEKDKLTAANPDPKVNASLKLLLTAINNREYACVDVININSAKSNIILFPVKGKSCKTNIL